MRTLTAKQKKLIDKWIYNDTSILSSDDLELSQFQQLEEIHDTEILWQEATRYIQDQQRTRIHKPTIFFNL